MRLYLAVCVLFLSACEPEPKVLQLNGETMGTTYNIIAIDRKDRLAPEDVKAAVEATLAAVNAAMSNWDPRSEVSRFNASKSTDPIGISAELAKVLAAAYEVHENSLGRFDVTLGPLIELWGFGAPPPDSPLHPDSPVPSDDAIAAALAAVGQDRVLSLGRNPFTLAKRRPDATVHLAAIAKGHGVDEVAATLRNLGLVDYMVEIGGDLVTAGTNPRGLRWRIGVERPDSGSRRIERIVDLTGLGMATSGDYRNYFEEDGGRYSHIIDAKTGRPVTHDTASVTVIAETAMMADAWATALLALGRERGLEISEKLNLATLFIARDISSDGRGFVTTASSRFEELQGGP